MILWIIFILKFGACYGIPGGGLMEIEEAPFNAAIIRDKIAVRTGAILSPNCILTIYFENSGSVSARAGSSFWHEGGYLEKVVKVIYHPKKDPIEITFDLCIVVIENNLPYTDKIQPVSLPPDQTAINTGNKLRIYGFGPQKYVDDTNKQLTYMVAEIVAKSDCQISKDSEEYLICVMCMDLEDADFGSPLAKDMVLYGIGSMNKNRKTIYANVFKFRDWINDVIKENRKDTTTSKTVPTESTETTTESNEPTKTDSSSSNTTNQEISTSASNDDDDDEVTEDEKDRSGSSCLQILNIIFYLAMFLYTLQ